MKDDPRNRHAPAAAAPGGMVLAVAQRAAEHVLWTRVAVQRRRESRLGRRRSGPASVPPTAVPQSEEQWRVAAAEVRALDLPLHRDRPKNWDTVGAVRAVLSLAGSGPRGWSVLDAGSADTSGITAYGVPVRILGPDDIHDLVATAAATGFDLVGELDDDSLAHVEPPVHGRTGLDDTSILLTFRRR